MTKLSGGDSKSTLYCSFCGKSQHEVRKLIAGPTVFICDECVELCNDIIREETKSALVEEGRRRADAAGDLQGARRLRDRPGPRQARALGRGAQPLQAAQPRRQGRRRRARQVEHPARRPDRLRQDPARADAGAHLRRAVHDGRRDDADRGRLCRRGCREHHPQAAPVLRLQRRAGAARHRLHRRDRQDQPQGGQSLDHPRRLGRGRAAGAAQADGRHHRLAFRRRAAASIRSRNSCRSTRPTSCSSAAARSPASRRSSATACRASRSASAPMSPLPTSAASARCCARASPRICSSSA